MGDKRQKNRQLKLAFAEEGRSEAPTASRGGSESSTAGRKPERPASSESLMEEVCERRNLQQALRRVQINKGSPGVDGMTVDDLAEHLRQHWPTIRDQLLNGTYEPQPVKRLDQELESRGLRFARYADDCNIYVCSRRSGERVMQSISRYLTTKLKLKVNEQKSEVARPWERKFLGFSFTNGKVPKRRIAPKALTGFKGRVRELMCRTKGVSLEQMVEKLSRYLLGWRGYFSYCETPSVLRDLDSWIHRRLRAVVWKQWRRGPTRFAELRKRNVRGELAAQTAGSPHGPWRLSKSPALHSALPTAFFVSLGVPSLALRKA